METSRIKTLEKEVAHLEHEMQVVQEEIACIKEALEDLVEEVKEHRDNNNAAKNLRDTVQEYFDWVDGPPKHFSATTEALIRCGLRDSVNTSLRRIR